MKKIEVLLVVCIALLAGPLAAQEIVLPLYPEGAVPNQKETNEKEEFSVTGNITRISKVITPDIAVFLPAGQNRTGEAVVICPGGGYGILAYDWEGKDIAKFWNSKGIAAIVLKYRLPSAKLQNKPYQVPLMDAQRAVRLVRYHSAEWNINPDMIGIMGFSAGGHLASSASTHFDYGNASSSDPVERVSCRPDFSLLIYPVIDMINDFQHSGSRKNLVGDDRKLMRYFSSELQITSETPPAILIHASDDNGVPVENSIVYYRKLIENKIPAALHIYSEGGHGFSLAVKNPYLSDWSERCYEWVKWLGTCKNRKK